MENKCQCIFNLICYKGRGCHKINVHFLNLTYLKIENDSLKVITFFHYFGYASVTK